MKNSDYQLLDSGELQKLERFGAYVLNRPCLQAVWPKQLPPARWAAADGAFIRDDKGGGNWQWRGSSPKPWQISDAGVKLLLKPTGFGHLGIFPEQAQNWQWLQQQLAPLASEASVLNLFAYTGGSSLAAAAAGASVTHVDAARGIIDWAKDNATANVVVGDRIRWIVDDAMKFCHREQRRSRCYHGIILDPPSFGRGPGNQLWKIDNDLAELLRICRELLPARGPAFFLLSCHTPGYTPAVLDNLLLSIMGDSGQRHVGEMLIPEVDSPRQLPAGVYARWTRGIG